MLRRVSFKDRDIVSIRDFSREDIEYLLEVSDLMEPLALGGSDMLRGKILAALFFEPSTRTRLSFESAMQKLGGQCVELTEPKMSSIEKGENLVDTIRVIENYADIIVLRHSLEGAARLAAEYATVPVINGGSGAEEHPTQALLDLYTIKREKGVVDNLKVALVGDLRYGRTVHSLIYALAMYKVDLYLVSPEPLRIRKGIIDDISARINVYEVEKVEDIIEKVDVLYVTRMQKERFPDLEEYERIRGTYKITPETIRNTKTGFIIMHPLPRVDEISPEVDIMPCAKYFKEVWYGLLVRMALISLVLGAID